MDERLERSASLVGWMIAGVRYDEPDTRHIQHLIALREAKRDAGGSFSPLAWLTAWLAPKAHVAASASGTASAARAGAAALTAPSTTCCAPA
jgi:hypothetical protein